MTDTTTATWLTQEAYDRLKSEYDHLAGIGRKEIADRIAAARDEGDLKENGGYHAAREEQAKQEARIRELKVKLDSARIGSPPDDGVVEAGMTVTAEVAGDEMVFLLGSREIARGEIDVFSPTSPLGAAIYNRSVGETVTYEAPNGRKITVVIKDAKPYGS